MEPGSGDDRDLKRPQGHSTQHLIEVGRTEGIEDLPQAVIIEDDPLQPRMEERQHSTLLSACRYLIEGMMAIQHRQEQRLHPTSTGE